MSAPTGEDAWLARAAGRFGVPGHVLVGIGDDAAAVRLGGRDVIVATDVLVDGVHFRAEVDAPAAIARKAVAVNLSDLAACAARPVAFVIGAVLPAPAERERFDALMEGFAQAAADFDVPCVGGDTNVARGPLVLAVTVLGEPGPMGFVTRGGARVGDVLSVTGPLGGSLARGRHLAAVPRVDAALRLARAQVPHAMIDVSDGLAKDLHRLLDASGVGARIEASRVPVHPDVGEGSSVERLGHALADGEDFELLLAHAPLEPGLREALAADGVALIGIGTVVEEGRGVRLVAADGTEADLAPDGWDHVGA